ncbi:L-glutamine:2-deoxy-scyllo-inosose/3-amino-2,3-dideoxy-scyllo-inosose aminotransferase [Actinoalloteichus hoggarensis]|uniref:L-glutamine:2-deoxy-scyllo-inosose aminotransferase n=1 Tax=Actinoalloteichus hoggarensis TaxID=1470176 RepID=A0A221VYY6_9PSEU|nr:DegT/DnrJ/EryC1/StrS family aminotransferase [Actinoalloteichus hoggarensis]ASO18737.1 L-glutamine:2-deoxy-scyllo-inosose aminotransferase [Actinoalloteichus hoggarensis]MBB5919970.1 L-glutamine:2-deoxy-scyllo-inosose/3-amino-2,3-dideoxy-scyllo-inosose aminotransferase [Actinoalloteichus hoggarensis]
MSDLALLGGTPSRRQRPWPAWPQYDERTEGELIAALRSRRWAVSWPTDGSPSRERRFAEEFARYNDVAHCVSVDHGSSALVVALEALDIGPGDEVIVPVMTWVAPVTAVLRVGALPVVVDVDPETGCLTPEAIREATSARTKAVIVVHLACTVADVDGIREVVDEAGISLIEDCAQAHGAQWRGRKVGTFGALGVFSFQMGKVLAGGEGGAVITSDPVLYRRAEQLRADSRRYADVDVPAGGSELVEDGEVMGGNYCMSELTAGVLLDQLPRLDQQHEHREKMAAVLEAGLAELGGLGPIPVPAEADVRSVYEYGIRFRPGTFGSVPVERVADAVAAELGMALWPPDLPLHRSVMFHPHTKRRFANVWTPEGRTRALGREYPGAERYRDTTLIFHHQALLGDAADMADIVAAVEKVRAQHESLS